MLFQHASVLESHAVGNNGAGDREFRGPVPLAIKTIRERWCLEGRTIADWEINKCEYLFSTHYSQSSLTNQYSSMGPYVL